jgi:hypothetical protein
MQKMRRGVNVSEIIHFPNLRAFMKRHDIDIGDLAKAANKSYPPIHQKITKKTSDHGKVAKFDIDEAKAIIDLVITAEQDYLKAKFGEKWETEWYARWGHINDWFMYLFFDEVVTNVTKGA